MLDATKILSTLVQPLVLLWILMGCLALRLAWLRKWYSSSLCLAGALLFFLIGSTALPYRLLATLERPYSGQNIDDLPEADAVIMLGGLLWPSKNDPFGFEFGGRADRAITALELVRRGKAKNLVLGGGGGLESGWSEAELLKSWFEQWPVTSVHFLPIVVSRNTREEALHTQRMAEELGWKRILLVTSGHHMRRAEAVFRGAGLEVVPVACDFVGLAQLALPSPSTFADGFDSMDMYLHEVIGWWFYRWKGWLNS